MMHWTIGGWETQAVSGGGSVLHREVLTSEHVHPRQRSHS